jgi:hypothetical protein
MPADLLPRVVFTLGDYAWDLVVWLLQRICGPAAFAYRPLLWRMALMVALHKRGDYLQPGSYRLILVKSQMGLLQEGLLSQRVGPTLSFHLTPG